MPLGSRAARAAIEDYLARDRPAAGPPPPRDREAVRQRPIEAGRSGGSGSGGSSKSTAQGRRGVARARQPAHLAAQLRHPLASRRRRPPRRSGNARPRLDRDHADLHPRRVEPASPGPRVVPPEGRRRDGDHPGGLSGEKPLLELSRPHAEVHRVGPLGLATPMPGVTQREDADDIPLLIAQQGDGGTSPTSRRIVLSQWHRLAVPSAR